MSVAMPGHFSNAQHFDLSGGPAGDFAKQAAPVRLRDPSVTESDRNYSVVMHLAPLSSLFLGPLAFIAPLIIWLIRREHSTFNNDHGREVLNMMLTGLILTVAFVLIPIIGWLALVIWYVSIAVSNVRGAMAAGKGEYFRYPMTFRFLSSPIV